MRLNIPPHIEQAMLYHAHQHGLIGRHKSSDNVPKDDPNWSAKVSYAHIDMV